MSFSNTDQKKITENQNVWRISIIFTQVFSWKIERCFTDKGKPGAALELYQSSCWFLVRLSNFAIFTGHLHTLLKNMEAFCTSYAQSIWLQQQNPSKLLLWLKSIEDIKGLGNKSMPNMKVILESAMVM